MNLFCTDRRCSWRCGNGNNCNVWLFDVRSKYIDVNTVPAVQSYGLKMVSLFEITFLYEKLFFKVGECYNTKGRTRIKKTRLENSLRIANRQIKANMYKFAKNKHCQISQ